MKRRNAGMREKGWKTSRETTLGRHKGENAVYRSKEWGYQDLGSGFELWDTIPRFTVWQTVASKHQPHSITHVICGSQRLRDGDVVSEGVVYFVWRLLHLICHQPWGSNIIYKCFGRIHSIPELWIQKQSLFLDKSSVGLHAWSKPDLSPHFCNSTWVSVFRGKVLAPSKPWKTLFQFEHCIYSIQTCKINREKHDESQTNKPTHYGIHKP